MYSAAGVTGLDSSTMCDCRVLAWSSVAQSFLPLCLDLEALGFAVQLKPTQNSPSAQYTNVPKDLPLVVACNLWTAGC